MRQAYDGFRAMGVDPLFDADLVSAVCFNHTDPFWGDLDGILFSRFSRVKVSVFFTVLKSTVRISFPW